MNIHQHGIKINIKQAQIYADWVLTPLEAEGGGCLCQFPVACSEAVVPSVSNGR